MALSPTFATGSGFQLFLTGLRTGLRGSEGWFCCKIAFGADLPPSTILADCGKMRVIVMAKPYLHCHHRFKNVHASVQGVVGIRRFVLPDPQPVAVRIIESELGQTIAIPAVAR
jgi:hypothetical protein